MSYDSLKPLTNLRNTHLTIIGSLIFVMIYYGKVIVSPNDYFFSIEQDGLSNYYSFAFHVKHDLSMTEFDGMKYPYGEYIPYVDVNPLLSNVLHFISRYIVDISDYCIGILNLTLIFTIVITSYFNFKILKYYGLGNKVGVIGAIAISILSSQAILWKYGHYALSYSFFLPLTWWLCIQFLHKENKLKWSLIIAMNNIIWIYVHNYLGFMTLFFSTTSILMYLILNRDNQPRIISRYFHLAIIFFLPIAVVFLTKLIFDTHPGRFDWPFVTQFRGSAWTVFYPQHSALRGLYDHLLGVFDISPPAISEHSWQLVGTFIGTSTIITLIWCLIRIGAALFKRSASSVKKFVPDHWILFIIPAIILLIYSFAFPFNILPAWILDPFPVLKQFISLGRFAWVFYYIITIYALWALKQLLSSKYHNAALIIASFMMLYEGLNTHDQLSNSITNYSNFFKNDRVGDGLFRDSFLHEVKGNFQAILPLPYYYKWNTPYAYGGSARSEQISMRLSQFTGIPLMSAFLARPSISEGENLISIFRPANTNTELQSQLIADQPIMVVWSMDALNNLERKILNKAKLLEGNTKYAIYSIMPSELFNSNPIGNREAFVSSIENYVFDSLSGYYHPDTIITAYYNSYEGTPEQINFRGIGAYKGVKSNDNLIYSSMPFAFQPDEEYIISFWYYNKLNQYSYNNMWLEELDSVGQKVQSMQIQPFASILFDKNWALNEFFFSVKNPANTVVLRSKGEDLLKNEFYLDELLIRPKNIDLYKVVLQPNGTKAFIQNNLTIFEE